MELRKPEEGGGGAAYDARPVEGLLGSDSTRHVASQAEAASNGARISRLLADEQLLLARVESLSSVPEVDATRASQAVVSLTLSRNS